MDNGWIKIHKKFLDSPLFKYAVQSHMLHLIGFWVQLLLMVNWQEKKWYDGKTEQTIPPGSLITSIITLSEETGLSEQQTRTGIDHFERMGMITRRTTNKWTQLWIVNWSKYQGNNEQDNKRITNEQQTDNKRITTTKEYKKERILSKDNIVPAEKGESKKDLEIDYILARYEKSLGYAPIDKRVRYVAYHLKRLIHKMLHDLEGTAFKGDFEATIDKTYSWYMSNYENMPGETLDLVYRRVKALLIPNTYKKYGKQT